MRAAERAHDQAEAVALQIDEAQVNGANLALRMGMLINGGAAIALLTFVGSLPADQKRAVAATLVWFAWGVVAAVGALGLLHFTNYSMVAKERSKQRSYEHPYLHDQATTKWWSWANGLLHILTILAGLTSLALFIVGMLCVRAALTKL